MTSLTAGNSPESVSNITPTLQHIGAEGKPPTGNSETWTYFNDSKDKYGWILQATKAMRTSECAKDTKSESACGSLLNATYISFEVMFGESPRLQISYLKSYGGDMGEVYLWIDDRNDQANRIKLSGKWDHPYSVAHITTIAREPLLDTSPIVVGEFIPLASLTPGKHTLTIAASPEGFFTDKLKWKLLGITAC
jgi:hypothetical protein